MTKIEWTEQTWNPVTGCTKVSHGCKHCYAERLWPKTEGARVKREGGEPRPFTAVTVHYARLNAPHYWKRPRRVFVNSMSDLFHEAVPDDFLHKAFRVMAANPQHQFQILTKRPLRMREWVTSQTDTPANVWLGVSVEDQETVNDRLQWLLRTPASVRFISYEPALGPIQLFGINGPINNHRGEGAPLHWVIAGGESGPDARPAHPDWFRSVRDQCIVAGVPFFFKQWGNWIEEKQMDGSVNIVDRAPKVHAIHDWAGRADGVPMYSCRIGKKAAGRLLDGREWSEYPST